LWDQLAGVIVSRNYMRLRLTLWTASAGERLGDIAFDDHALALRCFDALTPAASAHWGLEPEHGSIALLERGEVVATLIMEPAAVRALSLTADRLGSMEPAAVTALARGAGANDGSAEPGEGKPCT
jgi:hypothetical protein